MNYTNALPKPPPAPVINTTLSLNLNSVIFSLLIE